LSIRKHIPIPLAALLLGASAGAAELAYECSQPPLEAVFAVQDGRYSGVVQGGNLLLQADIPNAPVVKWRGAEAGKLYTLMMLDLDGNANGSWPDPVPPGGNAPLRHWIVGNIPGEALCTTGYVESTEDAKVGGPTILQAYRAPHIPVVSDRYGLYLFEQTGRIEFAELSGPITNFDCQAFLQTHRLSAPKASNFFVAIYTSESPFSGKPFHGNDVSQTWHKDHGTGSLAPSRGMPSASILKNP
jgi:Phosphatidylethanolamine-binding protein